VPGLGQLFIGRRRAAIVFLVPFALVVGWLVAQLAQGLAWFGTSIFDETFAATLIGVCAFLGLWRFLAVGHAFLVVTRGGRRPAWQVPVVALVLLSIVAAHGYAMAVVWDGYQSGVNMNNANWLSDASLADPSADPVDVLPAPSFTPTLAPTALHPSSSPGVAAITPTPTPVWPTQNPDRITFLLVGVDFMTGRGHALTDTMMLATLDVHTNKATMISVPRDTAGFDLYYGGRVGDNFRLNNLMSAAANKTIRSPDTAIETLKREIGFLTGLPVDYYAAVDMEGFVAMVEALGGIDIDVKTAVNDPSTGTFIPKGLNHMDGHVALKYCRSRESTSDWSRAARQQDVLTALATKVVSPQIVPKLPTLLALAGSTVATDFPLKISRNFVTAFRRVAKPYKCVLGPPYSSRIDASLTGGSWTSRLDIAKVANLSVWLFGTESTYYGYPGVTPAPCGV
jgi:LCP family protein required for cell wall assembly